MLNIYVSFPIKICWQPTDYMLTNSVRARHTLSHVACSLTKIQH
jgi:hypothetical protein